MRLHRRDNVLRSVQVSSFDPRKTGLCMLPLRALFFLTLCISINRSPALAAPSLDILNPVFDFDSIPQGKILEHQYILRNSGDEELEIQRIVPACGCTVPELKNKVIAPGEETVLSVQFNTYGMYGRKEKTVRLYTNDPERPAALLTLKGEIEPEVLVEPYRIDFGKVTHSPDTTAGVVRRVNIQIRDGLRARIGELSTRSKWIEIKEIERVKHKRVIAEIRLKAGAPIGEFRDRVVIRVSGAQQRTVNLPIYASVRKQIELEPPVVALGMLTPGSMVEREVRIFNNGQVPLQILSLTSKNSDINTTSEEVKLGKEFRLTVRYSSTSRVSEIKDTVTVIMGDASGKPVEEVVISVTGLATPQKG